MKTTQGNALKGAGLALLLAGGTGLLRAIEGAQRLLRKASATIATNVHDIKMMTDVTHDE
jgi:2-phospho-L-lactate transferase/gluconeogenesis factor (CofD/UPF0052 family)